jgi:hypothetical protein
LENVDVMVGAEEVAAGSTGVAVVAAVGLRIFSVYSEAENSEYCIELATEDTVGEVTPLSFRDRLEATASKVF